MGPGEAVRMLEDRPWGYCMDAEVLDVRGGSWAMRDGCSLPSISKCSFCGTQRKHMEQGRVWLENNNLVLA